MAEKPRIRSATPDDAAACAAVYAPYVLDTSISFEVDPPDESEMRRRIASALATHAWLVAEVDDAVAAYAYAGRHKERPAYRWSCEVSVYVATDRHHQGLGRALYVTLLEQLADLGFQTAVAGMTLPNPASEGLHRALGFEDVGTWRAIGHKHGHWRDVHWMQRRVGDLPDTPSEPGPGLSHI